MSAAEKTLAEALAAYDFGAPVVGAMRYGCGHINDTFCVHTQPADDCCNCFIGRGSPAFPDLGFRKHQQHISIANLFVIERAAAVMGDFVAIPPVFVIQIRAA